MQKIQIKDSGIWFIGWMIIIGTAGITSKIDDVARAIVHLDNTLQTFERPL